MAKKQTNIEVTLDMKQPKKELEKLMEKVDSFREKMETLKQKMNDPSTWGPKETKESIEREYVRLQKDVEGLMKTHEKGVKTIAGIDDMLNRMSGASYDEVVRLRTVLQNSLKRAKRETVEDLQVYEATARRFQEVLDEIEKRNIDVRGGMTTARAREIMGSPKDYSTKEIEKAIEVTKKLRDAQLAGSEEWKKYNAQAVEGQMFLDEFNERVKREAMSDQFKRLSQLSEKALGDQKRFWQGVLENAEKGTAAYIQAERKLKSINEESIRRQDEKAGAVMGNLKDYSVAEIEDAIKATEKLRDAQKAGSAEYQVYADEIKKAKEYLQSYVDLDKQIDMEDKWSRLPSLSADALSEQKKYWQEMVNGAAQGSKELQEYQDRLTEVKKEESLRLRNKYEDVLQTPSNYSVSEVQDAIKAFEKLRDEQNAGSMQWKYYNQMVEDAKTSLKQFNDEAKESVMADRLSSIGTASKNSLEEQKKYWQAMVDGAERGSAALVDYQAKLSQVIAEEKSRLQTSLSQTQVEQLANDGKVNKSVSEIKELIQQYEKLRGLTDATDADSLKQIDGVIADLKEQLKETVPGFMSIQEALSKAKNLNNFKGTIEELEQLKKRLEEIRSKEIKLGTADSDKKIKEIEDAIENVDRKIDGVNKSAIDLEAILKRPSAASLEKLQQAAKLLEEDLKRCAENTSEFAKKSEDLRKVNKQIEIINKSFKEQENIILKTAKRLASYVLVYAGFNEIVDKMKELVGLNLQLSDSIADVQKTTGLAGVELQELGKSIERIDTRTTTAELYQLAAAAGQIGLKSQEDILGFTKAANIISVALNELGAEGSANLMKIAQLTGELSSNTTEDALLKIGSAINELTANSAATAAPITDFINRFGGIAASAKIATYEMAALGAATDASAQSVEVAGTSMNKFVNSLLSNTQSVAYAANISYKELQNLIDSGKAMDAIVLVLERMRSMDKSAQMGLLKELSSKGALMNQYVSALVANLDMLKEQLVISEEAYRENISVQNEYNVKNESAIGILQRMKNQFVDTFVNSRMVEVLKDILVGLSELPRWFEQHQKTLLALRLIVAGFIGMKIPAFLKTVTDGFKQLGVFLGGSFLNAWRIAQYNVFDSLVKSGMAADLALKKVSGLTGAFRVLWGVMKANPIGVITTAITTAVALFIHFKEKTDELAKATEELRKKHEREAMELDAMQKSLIGSNSSYEDKIRIIKDLNTLYEKYLGFEIKILDSYEKKKAALDYINAKLREQHNLEIYNKKTETVNNRFLTDSKDSREGLENIFSQVEGITAVRIPELMNIINKALEEGELVFTDGLAKDLQHASDFINKNIGSYFNIDFSKVWKDPSKQANVAGILLKYMEAYTDRMQQLQIIEQQRSNQSKVDQENSRQKLETVANQQAVEIESLMETQEKELELIRKSGKEQGKEEDKINEEIEAKKRVHQQQMLEQYKAYQSTLEKLKQEEQDLIDVEISTAIKSASSEELSKSFNEETVKAVNAYRDMTDNVEKLQKELNGSTAISEKERSDKQSQLYEMQVKQASLLKDAQTKAAVSVKNVWLDTYKEVSDYIKKTNEELVGDPYGKGDNLKNWKLFAGTIENLKKASPESLVSTFKAIQEESQNVSLDGISKFNEMFSTETHKLNFDTSSLDKFNQQVKGLAEQIRARLRELGRDTEGNFLWGKGKTKKDKTKEEFKAALAALEAYFNERETLIMENGIKEGKTQSQIDKQIESLKTEKLKDEIELRKLLLEDFYKESTFDPSKYKGVKTGTDYFKEKNLEYLAGLRVQLEKWGVAMEDGMKKQLTDKMSQIAEQALKIREKINKILLEDNFTEKVAKEYLDNLTELGLLFGLTESEITKSNEEEGKRRLAIMAEWSKEAYKIDRAGLEKLVNENEAFAEWRVGRSAEEYEVLLSQLRKFHDDQEEAIVKAANRRKKLFDKSQVGIDLQKQAKEVEASAKVAVGEEEKEGKVWERFKGMGLATDHAVDEQQIETHNAQIALYQAKIDASQAYIDQIKLEMKAEQAKLVSQKLQIKAELQNQNLSAERRKELSADLLALEQQISSLSQQQSIMTQQAETDITENRQKQTEEYQKILDTQAAMEQRKLERFKQYSDAIVDWTGKMTEADWDDVESRKEATKETVKILLSYLRDYAAAKLSELAMKAMFNQQETAMEGQKTTASLGMKISETKGKIAGDGVQATGDAVAKYGWKGLLIGAAISAALTAVMNIALKKMFKEKSEVASISGSGGKLATGMLTYAEGNYPVLGNDGQVYNAKYEGDNIKTGIYRGGAHFGIFSEKKPEAIIDGDTTQRLIMNHPEIWRAIVTLSKTGRIGNSGMQTFASGNINDLAKQVAVQEQAQAQPSAEMMQMQATMVATQHALSQLTQVLAGGIHANINMYGDDGVYKSMKKAERFAVKRGYK